jgi:purine-binding chemotaxis protein CheW
VVIELELEGEPVTAAIRADKVYEVTEVAAASLQETPRLGLQWRPEFIRCIGKRGDDFMVVLDIARVFAGQSQSVAAPPVREVA